MPIKLLAIAGSSSKKSINKQLALFAAQNFIGAEIEFLDINDFEMPIFSVDREIELGPQEKAKLFLEKIRLCDFIVLSLAEHNGSYSAAFKNVLDWSSRMNGKLFQTKPMLLMATSPGARGGKNVLNAATLQFPFLGADIKASFSLPSFEKNFEVGKGITNEEFKNQLLEIIKTLN